MYDFSCNVDLANIYVVFNNEEYVLECLDNMQLSKCDIIRLEY